VYPTSPPAFCQTKNRTELGWEGKIASPDCGQGRAWTRRWVIRAPGIAPSGDSVCRPSAQVGLRGRQVGVWIAPSGDLVCRPRFPGEGFVVEGWSPSRPLSDLREGATVSERPAGGACPCAFWRPGGGGACGVISPRRG
jgi:hypothetical protein